MPQISDRGLAAVNSAVQNFGAMAATANRTRLTNEQLRQAQYLRDREDAREQGLNDLAQFALSTVEPRHPAEDVFGPVTPEAQELYDQQNALFTQLQQMLPNMDGEAALQAVSVFEGKLADLSVDAARGRFATKLFDMLKDDRIPEENREGIANLAQTMQDPDAPIDLATMAQMEMSVDKMVAAEQRRVLNIENRTSMLKEMNALSTSKLGAAMPSQVQFALKGVSSMIGSGYFDERPELLAEFLGRAFLAPTQMRQERAQDPMDRIRAATQMLEFGAANTFEEALAKIDSAMGNPLQGPTPSGLSAQTMADLEMNDPESGLDLPRRREESLSEGILPGDIAESERLASEREDAQLGGERADEVGLRVDAKASQAGYKGNTITWGPASTVRQYETMRRAGAKKDKAALAKWKKLPKSVRAIEPEPGQSPETIAAREILAWASSHPDPAIRNLAEIMRLDVTSGGFTAQYRSRWKSDAAFRAAYRAEASEGKGK